MSKPLQSFWIASLAGMLTCGAVRADGAGQHRRVMTWVPPYAVTACKERLRESFDGIGMKDGLTHLGLQFWNPSEKGGIELIERFGEPINEGTIAEFRKWGRKHGVQVLLCVYNGTSSGWDWDLAQAAFSTHRAELIEALVGETLRLGLDGVDIDFEGKGAREESRESFVQFIRDLSSRLHAEGRGLTVDTFAYRWNAPNQGWWPALLPYVDGLHVMGYSATGAGAADWRSYESLKAAAGKHASKLVIGMPGNAAMWQGASVKKHLQWVADDANVGLAIWDARLENAAWRTKETWQTIARIRVAEQAGGGQAATRPESK